MSEKKVVVTENAPAAVGPYSAGIIANGFVYTSGQLPIDPQTGEMPNAISDQARQSLRNISAVLEAAGCGMENVVKTTVFLRNMNEFNEINSVYAEFFSNPYPARSAIEVSCLPKGASIEIEAIAIIS